VLVEESVIGWKEFELEVMRDLADNVVIICSIENVDPMGVHTGDSLTVAPAQTLTDKEYQLMRDAAVAIMREIGVETGGSNIQFAVNPDDGRLVVIEMNPRVSRSSALASKATGFPIAKIAAKLAVGYTLDDIRNDITRGPRDPGDPRAHADRPVVPRGDPRDRRLRARDRARRPRRPRGHAAGQAARLRRPAYRGARGDDRGRGSPVQKATRRHRDLQDGGHVRRGVRRLHPVPLLDVRGGGRGAANA